MTTSRRKLSCIVLPILSALAAFLMPLQSVSACSPTPTPSGFKGFSIADYTDQATLVVEGTIRSVIQHSTSPIATDEAIVEIHRYLKGSGTDTLNIRGFGQSTLCLIEAHIGERKIFFVDVDSQGIGWIQIAQSVHPDTVAQVLAATPQTRVFTVERSILRYVIATLAVLLIIVVVLSVRRNN